MESENILKTCLHDRHVALGAVMSPFAGFDMPIRYTDITDESNLRDMLRDFKVVVQLEMCSQWITNRKLWSE